MAKRPAEKSEASLRQEELSVKLGMKTFARFPRELLEFYVDRPPAADDPRRADWKTIHPTKTRVLYTVIRYSWCYPISLEYAVATDGADEIVRHPRNHTPLVLSQDGIAQILGLSQQRVSQAVIDLIADKALRAETAPGRQHVEALFPEPKPFLTDEERRYKSTLVATGVPGPVLPPTVLRRCTSFSNELERVGVPVDAVAAAFEDLGLSRAAEDNVGTLVAKAYLHGRTVYLKGWKELRYAERNWNSDVGTRVRNLISQTQTPELGMARADSVLAGVSKPQVRSEAPAESFHEVLEARQGPTQQPDPDLVRELASWIRDLQGQFRNTEFGRVPVTMEDAGDRTTLTRIATVLTRVGNNGFANMLGFQIFVLDKFKGIDPRTGTAQLEPRSPDRSNGPKGLGLLHTWAKDWAASQAP